MSEFDLIRSHLTGLGSTRDDVSLDIGDDCALLRLAPGQELAVSIDTLVVGVHFNADCDPRSLGHKSLAVGLSDLAAVGAEPAWATLALTLPRPDTSWLAGFASGLDALARLHRMRLIGGDITRRPLTISIQVHGLVPTGMALLRAGAQPGDLVYVSGSIGGAGLALRLLGQPVDPPPRLLDRLHRPTPRVALGTALRGIASAAVDLSDGLAADLGHLLAASDRGARIDLGRLPLDVAVAHAVSASDQPAGDWGLPLCSGDDYELCFTVPPRKAGSISALARRIGCALTPIGRVEPGRGIRWRLPDGRTWRPQHLGYDHFPE